MVNLNGKWDVQLAAFANATSCPFEDAQKTVTARVEVSFVFWFWAAVIVRWSDVDVDTRKFDGGRRHALGGPSFVSRGYQLGSVR